MKCQAADLGGLEDEVTKKLAELGVLVVPAGLVKQECDWRRVGWHWEDSTVVDSPSSAALDTRHMLRRTSHQAHHTSPRRHRHRRALDNLSVIIGTGLGQGKIPAKSKLTETEKSRASRSQPDLAGT